MKIFKILILGTCTMLLLFSFNLNATTNPEILTVGTYSTPGQYEYMIDQLPSDVTNAFWVLGDGHFRTGLNPGHFLKELDPSHEIQAYLLAPYKLPPPTKLICGGSCTNNGVDNNNIPNHMVAMVPNQSVKVGTSWNPMKGRTHYTIITIENVTNNFNGIVKLDFLSNVTALRVNLAENNSSWFDWWSIVNTNDIIFSFSNLPPGEQRHLLIETDVDFFALGDKLHYEVIMFSNIWENVYQNNSSVLIKKFPHDPNNKIVSETEICAENNEIIPLEYQITFQNIGDHYAHVVEIFDLLPEELEISTFQITDFSYPCIVSWDNNEVKIVFDGIDLPGLDQIEPYIPHPNETIGHVTFEINAKSCLEEGIIMNKAIIVFDQLDEIHTPYTETLVQMTDYCYNNNISCDRDDGETGLPDPPSMEFVKPNNGEIDIYPNPIGEICHIDVELQETQANPGRLAIFNVRGELIIDLTDRLSWEAGKEQLNIITSDWTKGIYFVQLEDLNAIRTWKIIKM